MPVNNGGGGGGAGAGDMLKATYDAASVSEQLVGLTAAQTLTNKNIVATQLTGTVSVLQGGTGQSNAASARTALAITATNLTSGTLAILNGGTGQSNAVAALTALGGIGAATNDTLTNKSIAVTQLTGTLTVTNGGTGAGSFTSNGILYGGDTGPVAVTAQGGTNTILTASAGAPSWSATPIINTSVQLGVVSTTTGSLKLANSASANLTTITAGNAAAARTYVWPTNFGAAGTVLTDAAGDGTLSWAAAGGVSWGSSASGTTDGGLSLTLSNTSADGAAALKLTAGNTQASQPLLANLQLGSSGNTMGLLIQGKGSTNAGAAGTGADHLTIWGDTANNANYAISVGNGVGYTEQWRLDCSGKVSATDNTTNGQTMYAITSYGTAGVSNLINYQHSPGTNGYGSFNPMVTIGKSSGVDFANLLSVSETNEPNGAPHLTANTGQDLATFALTRSVLTDVTRTDTRGAIGTFTRTNTTNSASANYTVSGPTFLIQQVATQTAGTLLVSGPLLQVKAPASSAFFIGDLLQLVNNATTNLTFTATGNLCLGVTTAGATAANGVLCLSNGATAPTNSTDRCQIYAVDIAAGSASLAIFAEAVVTAETAKTADRSLWVNVNGNAYKILLSTI